MEETLIAVLQGLTLKFPVLSTVFLVIGILRAINKPIFALLRAYAKATPSTKDDQVLDKVEASRAYKGVQFVLDWTLSVKLPEPKKQEALPPSQSKAA